MPEAIVIDPFTEASDTDLTAHVPNTLGTGWTEEEKTGTLIQRILATDDNIRANGSVAERHIYSVQPNPTVAEYDIEATNKSIASGSARPWFLVARLTDANHYYSAGTYRGSAAADKKIFKKVGGTVTELASGDTNLAIGDVLKFEVRDAAKKLYQNGVEVLSTTDNALTSAGKAGFGAGDAWVGGELIQIGWSWDDFKVLVVAYDQEGYRFRDDDGSESAATWLAAQDVNISRAKNVNTRLRMLVDVDTINPPTKQATLQYRKVGDADSEWRDVP